MNESLFDNRTETTPLADRMRPKTLDDYCGQKHLIAEGKVLRRMIDRDDVQSMIFWGPPGVGKTTLAHIIAEATSSRFINFSAVTSGIKEIREVMNQAEENRSLGAKTILFVDEIHRFNKAQQDAFLPYVERGSIILIGATTENPSFEINSALLSRCKVFVLNALNEDDIASLLRRAIESPYGFGDWKITIDERMIRMIAAYANGDARTALNTLEMVIVNSETEIREAVVTKEILEQCISRKSLLYDKNGEEHYNLISALHKSMRNSDADAAVYWLARMLEAGEDPLYVARRVVRFASEDVGMADSRALQIAIAAYQACQYLGMPECNVHLTHAVVFCSLAPKSNSLEVAYLSAAEDAQHMLDEPVPLQIRNAPTKLMDELGYGKDYMYAHDYEGHITAMECLPESLRGKHYYNPSDQGLEKRVKEHKNAIEAWKANERKKNRN
ncbi:MAG: replication-associated recombination protein A [Solobacterium sp.]|nr:replication-associated recombination protein A [Solobacterium sp.]